MKPGTMTAIGNMLMASFPIQHEEMWTTDMENEGGSQERAYCRCGWVAGPVEFPAQVSGFINHLLELDND